MGETCRRCGSEKLIRPIPFMELGHMNQKYQATVQVAGKPEALVFTDAASGSLYIRICGNCGYTELFTSNPEELYEKYLKASGKQ